MNNGRRLLVLVVIPLAVATACSQHGDATGTLQGHLYGVGGPAPGLPVPFPGTITVTRNATSWEIKTGVDGFYTVTVPPGRYTVTGRSPHFNGGTESCPAPNPVEVSNGSTATLDAYCSLK